MRIITFVIIVSSFFTKPVNAQIIRSKLDIAGGISAREYIHIGPRYQYTEYTQIAFYIGGDLEIQPNETITTYCIDHQIHFGKHSFTSNRPYWYARQGYTLLNNQTGNQKTMKYSYLNFALGREIAFNDRLGVNFDLGLIWQFRKKTIEEPPLDAPLDLTWYTHPLARVQLFYSF